MAVTFAVGMHRDGSVTAVVLDKDLDHARVAAGLHRLDDLAPALLGLEGAVAADRGRPAADELAAAASLLQGEADEGMPVVVVRGLAAAGPGNDGAALIRAEADDLFR